MEDFFISYTGKDQIWAEWVAWQIEEEGMSVTIQAWDFVGNWVLEMDTAMKDAKKTIAILSQRYLDATYTHSEWGNAFRLDPKGEKDLLITIRIDEVEPEGILAQIVYVDLVNQSENDAKDLLLKRLKGERRKPARKPQFPGEVHHRVVSQKPIFPAEIKDNQLQNKARGLIVLWRNKYYDKIDLLQKNSKLARTWSKSLPDQIDESVIKVINFAAETAYDLSVLPINDLEFASKYGLYVHETVFWGQAIQYVIDSAQRITSNIAFEEEFNETIEKKDWIQKAIILDNYSFEMIARVLESALALGLFNLSKLPQGYLKKNLQEIPHNLSLFQSLYIASHNNDPELHLMTVMPENKLLGSFVARSHNLFVLCAQRNLEGSIDLLATDHNYLYYWQNSTSPFPNMEYPYKGVLDAQFLSREPGAPILAVQSDGSVCIFTSDDDQKKIKQIPNPQKVKIWIDPLHNEACYIISVSNKNEFTIRSCSIHDNNYTEAKHDIWEHMNLIDDVDADLKTKNIPYWENFKEPLMSISSLGGLPCLIIGREQIYGAMGIHFLDPKSLLPIHAPILIREFVHTLNIIAQRWLVVTLLKNDNNVRSRILIWDLFGDYSIPIGSYLEKKGDVYYSIVLSEEENAFQTLHVFRTLNIDAENNFELFTLDWPSGKITQLKQASHLRIWPVSYGVDIQY
ncbi:toll/interleukin-1 receptor domain-containing protein [Haliscomenobacter sp.]|uniref:toll/interleukin-1 receptor domain-containing protein n=1 Tax=Haliscomenobacter sp. TaxID=2717303 RepID=UPI003BAC3360